MEKHITLVNPEAPKVMNREQLRKELARQGAPVMPDIGDLMRFEQGEMEFEEAVELFQSMIDSGVVWQLQGFYGRTAARLIQDGHCTQGEQL